MGDGAAKKAVAWVTVGAVAMAAVAGGVWWFVDRSSQESESWLFSHTADAGSLEPQADGSYLLTLTGIDRHVTAFTDRPDRDAEVIDVNALVQAWPELFADSAPNAVLVEHRPEGETDSLVVELFNPVVTGDELSFEAAVLAEYPDDVSALVGDQHASVPTGFQEVSLFIDDVGCTGNVTACVYSSTFIPFDSSF